MATKTLQEKQALFNKHQQKSEAYHEDGNLRAALKELKMASKFVTHPEQKSWIQKEASELKSMIRFISENESDSLWKEKLKEIWEQHALKIYGVGIFGVLLVLGSLGLQSYQSLQSGPAPMSEERKEELKERFSQGDGNMTNTKPFGETEKDSNGSLEIKASDSFINITIPARLQAPYPERFISKAKTPLFSEPTSDGSARGFLPLNTAVYLLNKTPDQAWIHVQEIEAQKPLSGWVQINHLSDEETLTAAQKDARIKAFLGNRYWELEIMGNSMPFRYFLLINAPNATSASQAVIQGFTAYTKKQLVDLHNWQSMDQYTSYQVTHQQPKVTGNQVSVTFHLKGVLKQGGTQNAGHTTITVKKRPDDQRYYLRLPLNGM